MNNKLIVIALVLSAGLCFSQNIGVIPQPQSVEKAEGLFEWSRNTAISVRNTDGSPCNRSSFKTNFIEQIGNLVSQGGQSILKRITYQFVEKINADENAEQAYRMEIRPDEIRIEALSEAGFFNATQTIRQLYRYNALKNLKGTNFENQLMMAESVKEVSIPCMVITDWPNLQYRGWLDDISRGPVPTMDFIKKEIEILSYYKLNFFNLYTEHVFKLDKYPDIAPADGLTAEQIAELTAFAKKYNIEFIGNQQCFAHAEETLKIPFYDNMKDGNDNLNPNSHDTYVFLNNLFSEVAPAYESSLFNINCDETEGLGTGKAREYIEETGAEEAYCRHINSVYNILNLYDKQVMMWGDIVAKSPDMLNRLPKDIQFIIWSYSALIDYSDMIEPFRKAGHEFWIAPGVSMWSKCFPDIATYTINIANLVRDGYLYGAKGMMNTAWDDSGESLFNSAWHGMAWGAEMSWKSITDKGKKADRVRTERESLFNANFDIQFFGCASPSFTEMLYNTNRLQDNPNIGELINFAALNEPTLDFFKSRTDSAALSRYTSYKPALDVSLYIKGWKSFFDYDRSRTTAAALLPDEVAIHILDNAEFAAKRMAVAAKKNILRITLSRTLDNPDEANVSAAQKETAEFIKELHRLKCDYVRLWDRECRASSRDIVTDRYDKIAKELLDCGNAVFIGNKSAADGTPLVTLRTIFNDRPIFYTTDGSRPTRKSTQYSEPFAIAAPTLVKAICYGQWGNSSETEKYILFHKGIGRLKRLNCQYSDYKPAYSGGGVDAMLDGVLGSDNTYMDGHWQGFQGQDIDIEIDFGKSTKLNSIEMRFLQNSNDWILSPKEIEVYSSKDGKNHKLISKAECDPDFRRSGNIINDEKIDNLSVKTKYLRIVIKNPGPLPDWHNAKGYDSYIFCDEIVIK